MNLVVAIVWVCWTAVVGTLPLAAQPPAAGGQSPGDIQSAVARLKATVRDPLVTEAALASARAELERLAARLNEMSKSSAKDVDVPGPGAAAQLEIRTLLRTIAGRIGPDADAGGGHGPRAARAAGLSVPEFEPGHVTHDLAAALRTAQMRLTEQLRTASPGAPQIDEALAAMIIAEEALAWQAGWPFTAEEAKELKALKGQPTKADVAAQNELDRRIGELYARRRARGVIAINARLASEADAVGRATPPPFVLHRPVTRAAQREVERRLAELIASETGLSVQPGGPAVVMLSNGTRPFDAALAGALRGER